MIFHSTIFISPMTAWYETETRTVTSQ